MLVYNFEGIVSPDSYIVQEHIDNFAQLKGIEKSGFAATTMGWIVDGGAGLGKNRVWLWDTSHPSDQMTFRKPIPPDNYGFKVAAREDVGFDPYYGYVSPAAFLRQFVVRHAVQAGSIVEASSKIKTEHRHNPITIAKMGVLSIANALELQFNT